MIRKNLIERFNTVDKQLNRKTSSETVTVCQGKKQSNVLVEFSNYLMVMCKCIVIISWQQHQLEVPQLYYVMFEGGACDTCYCSRYNV